jgi:DNA end-binding protein Ku
MGAEKPYALLLRAMQGAGMVGIGRFVLRTKPHVVAIRPLKDALALETLFFADEVRSPAQLTSGLTNLEVSDREVKTAKQLITAMATDWIPEKHADVYREELLELLRSKPAAAPAESTGSITETPVGDLMAALRASVDAAKRKAVRPLGQSSSVGRS